jgi:hypothetical protein
VLDKAVSIHDANLRRMLADFTDSELVELDELLRRLRSARLVA